MISREFLTALLVTLGVLASFATSAQALPTTPSLGGTHPASPGVSTTPRVFGSVSEVSTSALGQVRRSAFAAALGGEGDAIAI